jgi:hypothetical protein
MHDPLPLILLGLSNGLHCPLLIDGSICQVIVRQVGGLNQAILKFDGQPYTVEVGFLLIRINMV